MEISIIIPTFKPGDYLYECLESISLQDFDKIQFEVIIVLNGERNPWFCKIKKWCSEFSSINFNVVYSDMPGVSLARNLGLLLAKGKYITFIDDDDIISSSFLQQLSLTSKLYPDSLIISNSYSFKTCIRDTDTSFYISRCYKRLFNKGCISASLFEARSLLNGPCMKLIPATFAKRVNFDKSLKYSEDALYMFSISRFFKKVYLTDPSAIYYRRIRSQSVTNLKRSYYNIIWNEFRFIYKILKIYSKYIFDFNFFFMISRICAACKSIILDIYSNFKK